MKRLAMFVMFLALGGFILGCGGDDKKKPTPKVKEKVETKENDEKETPKKEEPAPKEEKEEKTD